MPIVYPAPPPGMLASAAVVEALWTSMLAAGDREAIVRLKAGVYAFDRPLQMTSSRCALVGAAEGATIVTLDPALTPPVSAADDPTNTIIAVEGAVVPGGVSTTVAVDCVPGDQALQVAAAVTAPAGTWFLIEGNNVGGHVEPDEGPNTNVFVRELVQLRSAVSGATVLPLTTRARQYHSAAGGTHTVREVVPIDGARFARFRFEVGDRVIACGIRAHIAFALRVDDVGGGGFSSAMLRGDAVTGFDIERPTDHGGGNAVVYGESPLDWRVRGLRTRPQFARTAPHGTPWSKVTLTQRPTGCVVHDCEAERGIGGFILWGSKGCSVTRCTARDMDCTEALTVGGGGRNLHLVTRFGCGFSFGAALVVDPGDAGDGIGLVANDLLAVDCGDSIPTAVDQPASFAFEMHDTAEANVGSLTVLNEGRVLIEADGTARNRNGVFMQEFRGVIASILVRGCRWAIMQAGNWTPVLIGNVNLQGLAGEYAANTSLYRVDGEIMGSIERLKMANAIFFFSAAWRASPDYNWRIAEFQGDGWTLFDVRAAYAPSPGGFLDPSAAVLSSGGCVAVLADGAPGAPGRRDVVAPTGPADPRPAVIVAQGGPFYPISGPGGMLVAFGGGDAIVDAGGCAVGDVLVVQANGELTVDNLAVPPLAKFVAEQGAVGRARVRVRALPIR